MAPIGKHRQSLGVPRMKSREDATIVGEKTATTLKLWIIRIHFGGVVVEGYKQVSENDATTLLNWRSTPIARRLDSKTLETHSGSIYKLKGGIDEDEAAEAGIPEEIIEEFTRGFPENWEELVEGLIDEKKKARRRQYTNKIASIDETMEEVKGDSDKKKVVLEVEDTMDTGDASENEEERLKEAKQRRSIQKGRKSMMHRVEPAATIEEEEEEEEEKTPVRGKTPRGKTPARKEEKKTPVGRRSVSKKEKEEEDKPCTPSTSRTVRTPRGEKEKKDDEEEEVFATPDEHPRKSRALSLVPVPPPQQNQQQQTSSSSRQRRVSLENIPREIMEKSIPLSRWVIRFVKGGSDKSIFPHFQFKVCGFRPESQEDEWSTSVIQKVVPPYIMFTSSSIYRLDGPLDVDQATDMGFPPTFITDFLMGFPDDWDERLEMFFNKTFGPPPQPKIVELMSDCGTADDGKEKAEEKIKLNFDTPHAKTEQKLRVNGLKFPPNTPVENRKRKEPTPSSSSSDGEENESDEEEELRREAIKVEKEMRREEKRAQKEAEMKAKAKKAKEERFQVKINTTPDGVRVSRSGRTLRTPLASWAGETVTYDVHGNAVGVSGVTTTTKMTVGRTHCDQTDKLAAHFGLDSPLNATNQKERAIAPPVADRPKTPAPRKSKADYKGYSDDETEKIDFESYRRMLAAQAEATPAFILKKGKRRCNKVESSDSEAEAEERRKEEKRRKREERRRLRESEEEESSDDGWRRKRKSTKSKKKVAVKKEKQVKREYASKSKKKESKKKEEESEEDESEIEHDEDAVTFVPSDDGSNVGQGIGYSDDDEIQIEKEATTSKKITKKRAKAWKKEELLRLKLAIQAADPKGIADGWENVAKSIGGERTAEECKKMAREKLNMKVDESEPEEEESDEGWSGAESGAASEDEGRKKRIKGRMEGTEIKAKKGTAAYAVEMENKKREMLMSGGAASQEDFFNAENIQLTGEEALPSVAVFDPDDSLLEVFQDSPVAPKGRTTKTAKLAAAAATPRLSQLSSYDDSPSTSTGRRSNSKFIPSPVVNQNDLTRYVHHLSRSRAGNMSMLSKSMADQSRMMPPKMTRGRQMANAAAAITKVENKLRRKGGMGDLNEDEENEDNVLPDGF